MFRYLTLLSSYKYILNVVRSLAFLVVISGIEWSSGRRARSKAFTTRLAKMADAQVCQGSGVVFLIRRFNMLINMFLHIHRKYDHMYYCYVVMGGFLMPKSFFCDLSPRIFRV